jgi:flagellar motor switch protein FliN/FliY
MSTAVSDSARTGPDVQAILALRVPVIVRLGHRTMKLSEVLKLGPGSMIELPKVATEPLDLMINNKPIGVGSAVKIGEHFGIRVAAVGDTADRIRALGPRFKPDEEEDDEET